MSSENNRVHLFRGAPCVRGWSKYQTTINRRTLCGIKRARGGRNAAPATEEPSLVSCRFCHQLMLSAKVPDQTEPQPQRRRMQENRDAPHEPCD
jgi:hypothetical protein